MRQLLLGLIFSIVLVNTLHGQVGDSLSQKVKPFYGGAHFAGNTGFLSLSFGKKFARERLVFAAGYGYLPESVNGVEVHSIFVRSTVHFAKGLIIKKVNWYTGFLCTYGITDNTFIKLPSHYPDDYYAPNAIHFSPYLGLRMPFYFYKPLWAKKVFFHTELGVVDTYLWYSLINRHVQFWDICNISFGVYYDI